MTTGRSLTNKMDPRPQTGGTGDMINDELQSMMVRVTGWRQQDDDAPEKFVVERSQERRGKDIQNSLIFTLGDRINERSSKPRGVPVDKVDEILGTHLPVKHRHLIFGQHLVDELLDMTSNAFMKQLEPLVPQTVWEKACNLAKEKFVKIEKVLLPAAVRGCEQAKGARTVIYEQASKLQNDLISWKALQKGKIASAEQLLQTARAALERVISDLQAATVKTREAQAKAEMARSHVTAEQQCLEQADSLFNQAERLRTQREEAIRKDELELETARGEQRDELGESLRECCKQAKEQHSVAVQRLTEVETQPSKWSWSDEERAAAESALVAAGDSQVVRIDGAESVEICRLRLDNAREQEKQQRSVVEAAGTRCQSVKSDDGNSCEAWPTERSAKAKARAAEAAASVSSAALSDFDSCKEAVIEAVIEAKYHDKRRLQEVPESEGECPHCGSMVDAAHLSTVRGEREKAATEAEVKVVRLQQQLEEASDVRCWQRLQEALAELAVAQEHLDAKVKSSRDALTDYNKSLDAEASERAQRLQEQMRCAAELRAKEVKAQQGVDRQEQKLRDYDAAQEASMKDLREAVKRKQVELRDLKSNEDKCRGNREAVVLRLSEARKQRSGECGDDVLECSNEVARLGEREAGADREIRVHEEAHKCLLTESFPDEQNLTEAAAKLKQAERQIEVKEDEIKELDKHRIQLKNLCEGTKAHFGKRGVLAMLNKEAVEEIEARTKRLVERHRLFEDERIELRLRFKEETSVVTQEVRVGGEDGRSRSLKRLCGGEWRRLGLALSLAFCELAKERLNLTCNLLIFDQPMQHLDEKGQHAVMAMLQKLPVELGAAGGMGTVLLIEHGLSAALRNGLTVDLVERVAKSASGKGTPSKVRPATSAGPSCSLD